MPFSTGVPVCAGPGGQVGALGGKSRTKRTAALARALRLSLRLERAHFASTVPLPACANCRRKTIMATDIVLVLKRQNRTLCAPDAPLPSTLPHTRGHTSHAESAPLSPTSHSLLCPPPLQTASTREQTGKMAGDALGEGNGRAHNKPTLWWWWWY